MTYTNETIFETYPNLRLALAGGLGTVCVGGVAIAAAAFFLPVSEGMDIAIAATLGALETAGLWVIFGVLTILSLTLMPVGLAFYFGLRMQDVTNVLRRWPPED